MENPAPRRRAGDMHYNEPDDKKWRYDPATGNLVSLKEKEVAIVYKGSSKTNEEDTILHEIAVY